MNIYSEHTDLYLLELSKNGDEKAFSELYERHRKPVFQHAFLFFQDYDKAQDVMQEVFIKLWEKRESIQVNSSFKAYLHSMVRRINLNQIAHAGVARKYQDFVINSDDHSTNTVTDYIIAKELTEIIDEKIASLPQKMREVFKLSREEQLSHQEISDQLNISTKTVRQQIYNALLNLKSNLKYIFLIFLS